MEAETGNTNGYVCIELALEESTAATFNLEKVVCNHGFFMMAPNYWNPSTKTLQRPLRLSDDSASLTVSISHSPHSPQSLLIQLHTTKHVSSADQQVILSQVSRMLRISKKDEIDVQEFHKAHPQAKRTGFGRLFRSPSLFEDVIKSILLCNCTWMRTLCMAKALCELQLELTKGLVSYDPKNIMSTQRKRKRKRKRSVAQHKTKPWSDQVNSTTGHGKSNIAPVEVVSGNFPTAKEVASLSEEVLNNHCNLGYRAQNILEFAKSVERNEFRLQEFDWFPKLESSVDQVELYKKLMKVDGFGPFSCANVMMCIGFYDRVPQDLETTRHLSQYHARKDCNKRSKIRSIIEQVYGKYAPFQCLAYWCERVEYYESKLGRLSNLPTSSYNMVTGSILTHKKQKIKMK